MAKSKGNIQKREIIGSFTTLYNEQMYKIENYDFMTDFFMTMTSSTDVWNFLWSKGGLTAGRTNANYAIFPYYTADKVSDFRHCTGAITIIKIHGSDANKDTVWIPFSDNGHEYWDITRTLYKNSAGSTIWFEESNKDLGIIFRYGWTSSEQFGLVKPVHIINVSNKEQKITVLDGAQNIMPSCVDADFQNGSSVLIDAYKQTEIYPTNNIALFSLTSVVTDKAEPSESLYTNISWFTGKERLYISPDVVENFLKEEPLNNSSLIKGQRPVCCVVKELNLSPTKNSEESILEKNNSWYQVFDTWLDQSRLCSLAKIVSNEDEAYAMLENDIKKNKEKLEEFLRRSDGIQKTADLDTCVHHKANVLFNIMRGGIIASDEIELKDFYEFILSRNKNISEKVQKLSEKINKDQIAYSELEKIIGLEKDSNLYRLFLEYIPLTFSRRHGDPSRPWNFFSIHVTDTDGRQVLNYEGNWRDIFQNWEALAWSWPQYVPNMMAKFLNATTVDGFNPYRISRAGIDWEAPDVHNPWANIGYWNDHQIIYFAKLLELQYKFNPHYIFEYLDAQLYSTSAVPYRIKPYSEIVKNPRDTIIFDREMHNEIHKNVKKFGNDAKLLCKENDYKTPLLFSLTVKIFQLVLAKMANIVPGGGVWLNTQRPEWNDANNALAGYGLSMVTVYYVHRFLIFLQKIYTEAPNETFQFPKEVADLFNELTQLYQNTKPESVQTPEDRKTFTDNSGYAFEKYRTAVYSDEYFTKEEKITKEDILRGISAFLCHVEYNIRINKRSDGLYHAYNTMAITEKGMHVHHLPVMLEGQVAALSSGLFDAEETIQIYKALHSSDLYVADRNSYILYPDKKLPHFWEKNSFSLQEAESIPLLQSMIKQNDRSIVRVDCDSIVHFHPDFRNVHFLIDALEKKGITGFEKVLELYEKVFDHQSFTGRSGSFYAYEGLGSIYWHMISKLLLAIQEAIPLAQNNEQGTDLINAYYEIREGIGFNKTPVAYGAFPHDPYSHTPAGQGAKQPGMTGQVKEEIITRWTELGVTVQDGVASFDPQILRNREYREDGSLEFTWCGVPIVYQKAQNGENQICVHKKDNSQTLITEKQNCNSLTKEETKELMARSGKISKIEVFIGQ